MTMTASASWGRRIVIVTSDSVEMLERWLGGESDQALTCPELPALFAFRRVPPAKVIDVLHEIGESLGSAAQAAVYEVTSPEWTGVAKWSPRLRHRELVVSSNVRSIGYDAASKVLEVEFRDRALYRYVDVSAAEHHALMAATSKGHHLATVLRPRHEVTRVRRISFPAAVIA